MGLERALAQFEVRPGGVAVSIFVNPVECDGLASGRQRPLRSNLPPAAKMLGWDRELLLPIVVHALPAALGLTDEEG
jgi:hypothetical protein